MDTNDPRYIAYTFNYLFSYKLTKKNNFVSLKLEKRARKPEFSTSGVFIA